MGAGVYYSKDGRSVLTDGYSWDDSLDDWINHECSTWHFHNLIDDIRSCLPKTYEKPYYKSDERGIDGSTVIAFNEFYEVSILGWECDYAIIVQPKENPDFESGYHPLCIANLDVAAERIFSNLSKKYDLRVRTSGYTTSPYTPPQKQLAA